MDIVCDNDVGGCASVHEEQGDEYDLFDTRMAQVEGRARLLRHIYEHIKYRPNHIGQMVFPSSEASDFYKLAVTYAAWPRPTPPNILLHGPPGCGKTTFASLLCRDFFQPHDTHAYETNVLRLNAGNERTLDAVRKKILPFVQATLPGATQQRFVVLDEADNLTIPAQSAIRKTMEDYAQHTCFIIIGNNTLKIMDAIKSRCRAFAFPNLAPIQVRVFIARVLETWDAHLHTTPPTPGTKISDDNTHLFHDRDGGEEEEEEEVHKQHQYHHRDIADLWQNFCGDTCAAYLTQVYEATRGDARLIYAHFCDAAIRHLKHHAQPNMCEPNVTVSSKDGTHTTNTIATTEANLLPTTHDARTLLQFYFNACDVSDSLVGGADDSTHNRATWFSAALIFTQAFRPPHILQPSFRGRLWDVVMDAASDYLCVDTKTPTMSTALKAWRRTQFALLLQDLAQLEHALHTQHDIGSHLTWFDRLYPPCTL